MESTRSLSPVMRHVPYPEFLASRIASEVRRAVTEIERIAETSPAHRDESKRILEPLARRVEAIATLLHLGRSDEPLIARIDRLTATLREQPAEGFRALPSYQSFYRARGERLWTSCTALFAETKEALERGSQLDASLFERYLDLDVAPIPSFVSE